MTTVNVTDENFDAKLEEPRNHRNNENLRILRDTVDLICMNICCGHKLRTLARTPTSEAEARPSCRNMPAHHWACAT